MSTTPEHLFLLGSTQRGFPWGWVCWGGGAGSAAGGDWEQWEVLGAAPACTGGAEGRELPSRCSVMWPPYQMKLQSPISSALVWDEMPLPRGLPALGRCLWHSQREASEQASASIPLLLSQISFQDNQELRTTKYPAPGLCEEPSPALHVSVLCSCPCPHPLCSCSKAVATTPQSSRREDAGGDRAGR